MSDRQSDRHLDVSGDFANVFDGADFLAMLNTQDEASVALKAHLILEEFLNIWSSKITGTSDMFAGGFVSFKTKLNICRNLGLSPELYLPLDKSNDLRNRYSHRRKFTADSQQLDAVAQAVDRAVPDLKFLPCREFSINSSGSDQDGVRRHQTHTWEGSDNSKKIFLCVVILTLKLTHWMQETFDARGIHYKLISSLPTRSGDGP